MKKGRMRTILRILILESNSILSCARNTLNNISENDLKIMKATIAYVMDRVIAG